MHRYIVLENWTEQGVNRFHDSPNRVGHAQARAERVGGRVVETYWTVGPYDMITVLDAPDTETVSALLLSDAALGNVRTITMRAYDHAEMATVIKTSKSL